MSYDFWIGFLFLFGFVLLISSFPIYGIFHKYKYIFAIFILMMIFAFASIIASTSMMIADVTSDNQTRTNLGTGIVISLNNSVGKHSVTTHTNVRLNGMNYRCYGYVPDAKHVDVIEIKRNLSGSVSYICELPED